MNKFGEIATSSSTGIGTGFAGSFNSNFSKTTTQKTTSALTYQKSKLNIKGNLDLDIANDANLIGVDLNVSGDLKATSW